MQKKSTRQRRHVTHYCCLRRLFSPSMACSPSGSARAFCVCVCSPACAASSSSCCVGIISAGKNSLERHTKDLFPTRSMVRFGLFWYSAVSPGADSQFQLFQRFVSLYLWVLVPLSLYIQAALIPLLTSETQTEEPWWTVSYCLVETGLEPLCTDTGAVSICPVKQVWKPLKGQDYSPTSCLSYRF